MIKWKIEKNIFSLCPHSWGIQGASFQVVKLKVGKDCLKKDKGDKQKSLKRISQLEQTSNLMESLTESFNFYFVVKDPTRFIIFNFWLLFRDRCDRKYGFVFVTMTKLRTNLHIFSNIWLVRRLPEPCQWIQQLISRTNIVMSIRPSFGNFSFPSERENLF